MVYNIGSNDLPLGEIGTKVNDNTYHVVRFQRFGGNATLQLDDYNVQTVHPQGLINSIFELARLIQTAHDLKLKNIFLFHPYILKQVINQPCSIQWQTYKWVAN